MMTIETNPAVRRLVIIVLSTATAGMIAVSLRANYLFGYGFGETPERGQVFGLANVAADTWKVAGLIVVGALWRARRRTLAATLTPIWLFCFLWGLIGAIGINAQDRTALIGSREAKGTTYREREQELKEVEEKLQRLGSQRSVAEVDAAIEAVYARPIVSGERIRGTVGKLSAKCVRSEWITAAACAEVAELREERAVAVIAEALAKRRRELQDQMVILRESGGSVAADPVAELFAWLSRGQVSVRDIAFGFPLLFAFLVEIVSALGPVAIVAYAEATRKSSGAESESMIVPLRRNGPTEVGKGREVIEEGRGRMLEWIGERCRPARDEVGVEIDTLYDDYDAWCAGKGTQALSRDGFMRELDGARELPELAGETRKIDGRYYGIELVDGKIKRLPTRKRGE